MAYQETGEYADHVAAVPKPVWPFALLTALSLPAAAILPEIAFFLFRPFAPHWYDAYVWFDRIVLLASFVGLIGGTVGMVTREVANARLRTQYPGTPTTAPAWPYAVMAVLAPLLASVVLLRSYWLYDGRLWRLFSVLVILAASVTCAIIRASSNAKTRTPVAPPQPAPVAPVGYTNEGQPIYPIIGYTPDGRPVTADRAAMVRPSQSSNTNTMALAALITALVMPLAGVIFGHIAQSQIRKTGEQGAGMALAGLIIGYLGLAASAIFVIVALATTVATF